jgi:peptide/nickel transport system substrate-binding protein
MRKLRWPLIIALLAVVAIVVLLLGQQPTLLPVQPVVEPTTGGVYTEGLVGSLIRLNPLLDLYNPPDRDVDKLIFSGLLRFNDRGEPQGDLADSWGISRDGTVYNLSLRPNAVWHDGEPVTSDDVLFTIDMMRDPDSNLAPDVREMWNQVEVESLDEKSIQFRLPEPFAPFLDYLTFGIIPAHLLGGLTFDEMIDDPFNLEPIGSGAYRFDRIISSDGEISGVVLSGFEDYYSDPPYIEQVAFRYYPDAGSALDAYKEGEILGVGEVSEDILNEALAEPELNMYTGRLPLLTLIFLNLDNPEVPFFQDINVRRALMMSLNRRWIIDRLRNGQGIIADGPIFPGTWAHFDGTEQIEYDVDKAIKLLRETGYTIPAEGGSVRADEDGNLFEFELLYPIEPGHKDIAEAIRDDWAKIGVRVNLTAVPYNELIEEHLETHLYNAALVDINLFRSPDPDPYPFWHQAMSTGGQNYSQWNDRQASEYLEQARITADITERTHLYNNFQVRFIQELPSLTLFYPVYTYAVGNDVQGVSMGPLFDPSDRFGTITDWFLVTKRSLESDTTGELITPTVEQGPQG